METSSANIICTRAEARRSMEAGRSNSTFLLLWPLASPNSLPLTLWRERERERERDVSTLSTLAPTPRSSPPPGLLRPPRTCRTRRALSKGERGARARGPRGGRGAGASERRTSSKFFHGFFFFLFFFLHQLLTLPPFFDLFSTSSPLSRPLVRRPPQTQTPQQVIQPINGDPFIGMLETPVTSSPLVASYLSSLPAYRTGVSPLLRGVEIGLAHGLLVTGPFIKLGPLRDAANGVAEKAGCASGAGLVLILTACLAMYGASTFQNEGAEALGVKTLSGRAVARDPLQSGAGWSAFTAGWLVGGLSGVAWAYVLTQVLPYYS